MEPGTHYLAKLELIIMFHGALRKFRLNEYDEKRRREARSRKKWTLHTNARAISKKMHDMYRDPTVSNIFQLHFLFMQKVFK